MITSQSANQEIDEAIERLQKKMQAVSDNFEQGRSRIRSTQKKEKARLQQRSGKGGAGRLLKYFFVLLLLGATSFVIAQISKGYINSLDETNKFGAANVTQDDKAEQTVTKQPTADIVQSNDSATSTVPASFSMQSANYDIVESELGPVLDIVITVANVGGVAGRPELFEIELVDDANEQLMKWPMAVSGASIAPEQQMIYKTRLIEPPANFKNIRVTMKK